MININLLRSEPEKFRSSEQRRGHDPSIVDNILRFDEQWRSALKEVENLKHKRNVVSEQINQAKKSNNQKLAEEKIKEMKTVAEDIRRMDAEMISILEKRNTELKKVGNLLHHSVHLGKDEQDNATLRKSGQPPQFSFPIKDHIELGLSLDLLDLDTASKVSGARFYYLKNEAVLLDLALQRFAVDIMVENGFKMIYPPLMLNRAALEGSVNLSEFEDTIYKIDQEDLYLIGTSEHPLIALKKDFTFELSQLPFKLGGISTCFRKEAGSHGRDTKGIFRVHQFNKVEQIVFSRPEESYQYFHQLQALTEKIFQKLNLPYRVVQICSGDIGNKQALQYDIEAWFPAQNEKKGAYREVTSCSNCTDYQSLTLNIKYLKPDNTKEYVHILNNTALATSRVIVAIFENFQTKEGTIKVPPVLYPYMSGITEIGAKRPAKKASQKKPVSKLTLKKPSLSSKRKKVSKSVKVKIAKPKKKSPSKKR
jgi:seryl-tRNA synthetase